MWHDIDASKAVRWALTGRLLRLDVNYRSHWRTVSAIRLKPHSLELVVVGNSSFFGQQFFDLDCQIIEMIIAYDWVNKLRACTISEEESRLFFTLAGKRQLAWMLSRLALALELFKELDLALEPAASFRECMQLCLWVSQLISRVFVSVHAEWLNSRRVIFGTFSQRLLDIGCGESEWRLLRAIKRHCRRCLTHIVQLYTM